MNQIESAFFNALQHSISGKPLDRALFADFGVGEWTKLHKLSRKQGVLALVFDALKELSAEIPQPVKLQWAYGTMQIEDKIEKQWQLADELCGEYSKRGIKTVVLKGTPVFLPGESPWAKEPGGLQSMRLQRVRHD